MTVDRVDVPLNGGYVLTVHDDGETFSVRLLAPIKGVRTFLTRKIEIQIDQLEVLRGSAHADIPLCGMRIWTEGNSISAQIENHCAWGGRATFRVIVGKILLSGEVRRRERLSE